MKAIVVGCGRVGSAVAKKLTKSGWDVTAIDENEEALARLGDNWSGGFVVGHGMDVNVLREAGIEEADAVVVATNGDNTNIVVRAGRPGRRFGIGVHGSCASSTRHAPSSTRRSACAPCRRHRPRSRWCPRPLSRARSSRCAPPRPRLDVRPRRRRRQGGLERRAHAAPDRPRGDDHRAAARPLRLPRGGVRARGDRRRRDRDLRAASRDSRPARTSSSRSRETTRTTWSSARWRASTTAWRR